MKRPTLRMEISGRVHSARILATDDRIDEAWSTLADAHVLSQPLAGPHIRVHVEMLRLGWTQRDGREIGGQLVRIALAGPGSLLGKYPVGNSGRARVSAFAPSAVRSDLSDILESTA